MAYKIIKVNANIIIRGKDYGSAIENDHPEYDTLDSLESVKNCVIWDLRRVAGRRAEEYAEDRYLDGRYDWQSGVTTIILSEIVVKSTETGETDTVCFAWSIDFVDIDVYENEWEVGESFEVDYDKSFYYYDAKDDDYYDDEEPEPPADKEMDDDEIPPSAFTVESDDKETEIPDGLYDDLPFV